MNDNMVIPISAMAYEKAIDALAAEVAALRARLALAEAILSESVTRGETD